MLLNESVQSVTIPTEAKGLIEIRPKHANLLSKLETGILKWKDEAGKEKSCSITTGFVEVFDGNITVLSQVSELASEIDIDRAKEAENKAQAKIREGMLDDGDFKKHELKLKRSMMRQKLAIKTKS